MLTDEQIKTNKDEFISLVKEIKREDADINRLIKYLEESDFFIAPASTQYHSAYKGGLCQHSLNVYKQLKKLIEAEFPKFTKDEESNKLIEIEDYEEPYDEETLIIVALLHDLSKTNFYEVSTRNVKDENGQWTQVPFIKVREAHDRFIYSDHGSNSEYMISKFIPLRLQESIAIMHHMGWSDDHIDAKTISEIFNRYPLAMYLHLADVLATFKDEQI